MEKLKVGGIIKVPRLSQLGLMSAPDRPGIAGAVFEALGDALINAQFIVQCVDLQKRSHVILCVGREDMPSAMGILQKVKDEIQADDLTCCEDVAIISVFGPDFRERPGISGPIFAALAAHGINIRAISTSISTVSCVIDGDKLEKAEEALAERLDLP